MVRRGYWIILVFVMAASFGLPGGPARAQEVKISYSDWQLAQDIWGRSLREAIAEFERLNPGIKVEAEPVALAQRDVKFTTAIRAGEGPDVFALDVNPVKQYIKEGWVTPPVAETAMGKPFFKASDGGQFDISREREDCTECELRQGSGT